MGRKSAIMIFIIALVAAALLFYVANQLSNSEASADAYKARREDLYSSQVTLQNSINELNATLQVELQRQDALETQVKELYAKADLPAPVITVNKTVQEPPVVIKTPPPVTRAS